MPIYLSDVRLIFNKSATLNIWLTWYLIIVL